MSCGNSGNDDLFHNFCCHDIPKSAESEDWESPIQSLFHCDVEESRTLPKLSLQELKLKVKEAEAVETTLQQLDSSYATPKYDANRAPLQPNQKLGPLSVLDLFSGIGAALSALKRLKIAVKTFISVEDDPVARHVAKYNHVSSYNETIENDDIKFVDKFNNLQEINENLDGLLKEYGPINLVTGSTQGQQGYNTIEVGMLIKRIKRHPLQKNTKVFFLSENHISPRGPSYAFVAKSAYDNLPPILFDSKELSPCSKALTYWTNLPIDPSGYSNGYQSEPTFGAGFEMPEKYCIEAFTNDVVLKAKSLQPLNLIDDSRMFKVKATQSKNSSVVEFEVKTFSVGDREKMLGFFCGYVENSLKVLFDDLRENAFMAEYIEGSHWSEKLHQKYYDLARKKFGFKRSSNNLFDVLIHEGKMQFDAESYGKHLLGKSSNIALLEHLLSPISKICEARHYYGFDYEFYWKNEH